uniref:RNA helicase n=1 Tax=Anopheles merus TaxID=30066 RepID=A0A182VKI6_ANOME
MVGPSSQVSKILLSLLFLLIAFFAWMDVNLYIRIQDYPIRDTDPFLLAANSTLLKPASAGSHPSTVTSPLLAASSSMPLQLNRHIVRYEDVAWVNCDLNPLCDVTVKAMMLDHTNHYLFAPIATIVDNVAGFSQGDLVTPNMISFFHVFVAIAAGRMIASDSLGYRRIGVVLFQFRTFLDDLDGHVARAKKHIRGERSDIGSAGYYIDGICDGLGCIALMIGVFVFLKNNPPRRGYTQLQSIIPVSESKSGSESGVIYKVKVTTKKVARKVLCYTGMLVLSSTGWNRYIAIYQDMLERENVTPAQYLHQESVFRSTGFFVIAWLWRIFNVHALLHFLLLSVFCDKLWEYLRMIQYAGYVALLVIISFAEMHLLGVQTFIYKSLTYLYEFGWHTKGLIGITEPRRISAITLADRVATERGELCGETVGVSIRFISKCDPAQTKIKYMTEGILLREMLADPLLTQYAVIMVDEAHERNTLTDTALGLLKKIARKRPNLRIIISSATVDAELFRDFFNLKSKGATKDTAVILTVEGRMYAQEIYYLRDPCPDYVKETVNTVMKIHRAEGKGDVLAFLTGQEEVLRAVDLLREHVEASGKEDMQILPMYGTLSNADQLKVFFTAPKGVRKVVLATNIAETSVTIPGIVYVIDCGFVKLKWYSADSTTDSLVVVPVSKAAAEQRAGRAGRIRSGKVYRLYTEEAWEKLPEHTPPEMRRSDLCSTVLFLKALGIDNILRFTFPSPPPAKNLLACLETLYALEALDAEGQLTSPVGYFLAEMSIPPMMAKMLYKAGEMGCSEEILIIIAMLQVQSVFSKPAGGQAAIRGRIAKRNFEVAEGDLITLLNVYCAFVESGRTKEFCGRNFLIYRNLKRAHEIKTQLAGMLERELNIPLLSAGGNVETICRCIVAGFFPYAAYLHHSGVYRTVRGNTELSIHPLSALYTEQQPQWVVFCELIHTTKLFMKDLTVIQQQWLPEIAPHYYHKVTVRDHLL